MDIRYCVSISFATFPPTQDSPFAAAGESRSLAALFFSNKTPFPVQKVAEKLLLCIVLVKKSRLARYCRQMSP
jgi:hypothetical protein